jgi:hypothetical protein
MSAHIEWREVAEGPTSLPGKDLYVDGVRRGCVIRTTGGTAIGYADGERLGHWLDEEGSTAGVLRALGLREKLQ